ncbi:prenyltransferase/squalene oxidase repeat-containing protein [Micromonospora sp. NPDC093277]|uniref:prenyltransferase/squalene oxidase repeat-containing protein n=1 Tax=Micromonospora sp. NPDC093277 TaxID=3364291 RepID=UPI003820C465
MPVPARRSSRLWASLATLITLGITTVVVSVPAAADPIESCTPANGAVVAVDFRPWGGQVLRGCDATPTTGFDLLHEAGFTTTGTVHDGPGFICRIGNATFEAGTQYPKPDQEACTLTPPATAYWSYWFAPPGQRTWTYSPLGAMAKVPGHGEVQAWVYGGTDVGGTTGQPTFTPDEVRAAGTTPPATATPTIGPGGPGAQPTPAQIAAATAFLAGNLTDGDHVYDADWETVDFTRTIVVATALAAAGGQDPALAKLLDYLAAHVDAAVFPDGAAAPPNQYNAASLSLLVTITGGDPHTFGGRDLTAVLTDRVCTALDPLAGCAAAGDFAGSSSPSAHATALLALRRAGITPPASTVERLLQWQCAGGGFADSLIAPGELCTQDPANTGTALLALTVLGGHDAAITAARQYLTGAQQPGGGFLPYVGAAAPETYVTALAAQGLIATAATQPAAEAIAFLTARITGDGGLAADTTITESDLVATSGAVATLAGGNLATLSHPLGGEPPQGPTPDLAKGVEWLVGPKQLIDGRYYESFPGYPDFGLSIDGAFALAATGRDDSKLRAIIEFIRGGGKVGDSEFTVDSWLGVGTSYPSGGAIGKVALLAQASGYDPRSFGGHDLIAALRDITCTGVDAATGCAGKGNYRYATSVFSQALGIMAQLRAGQQQDATAPIEYLRQLQRASGAFPSLIPADGSGDEVDSTAMAAMALALLTDDPAATAAVDKALTWLAAQQKAGGGFPGAAGDSTNSTALAIQGLTLRRSAYAAHIGKALAFLAGQQNPDGGFNVASDGQPGSDVRASTQVVSGATGISFGTLVRDVHDGVDPTASPSASPSRSTSPWPSQTTARPPASGDTGPGTAAPGGLPVTGLPLAAMVVAAATAIIVGVVLLLLARQRRREAGAPRDVS